MIEKISKNKRVKSTDLITDIKRNVGYSNYKRHFDKYEQRLIKSLDNYSIYTKHKKRGSNILFRLSIIIYLPTIFILFYIVSPIKWLIFGNYYWDINNKFISFLFDWESKIF